MSQAASGVVLAGGASRRMGRDKRSLLVGGRPLLVAAVAAAAGVCDEVLVVTATGPAPVALTDVRTVVDRRRDAGPLAGMEAGMLAASHPRVLVLAGDHPAAAPGVLADLLDRLARRDDLDAVVLGTTHGPQPLVGAYRRTVAGTVGRLLDGQERRAQALLTELEAEVVEVAAWRELDPRGDTAVDLDTPEDLVAWQARP